MESFFFAPIILLKKFFRLSPVFFCLVVSVSCGTKPTGYYSSAKPITRWWWFASEIKQEDVADQLEWIKSNGFGGVEVAWIYPLNRLKGDTVNYTPRQPWLSPEWTDIVVYAKKYADSLELSMDFTFGSLWPFGDLQVTPAESTKKFGQPEFRQWIRALWDYPEQGLVIDHLNGQAFANYAGRMNKGLKPAMSAGGPSGVFVDSWEVQSRDLWTTGFDSVFQSKFGYDIVPFMEKGILSDGLEGPRYDYMKLVSEMVIENFFMPFSDNVRMLGGFSRGQCMGSPTDILKAYSMMDVPESEAMLYEPYYTRIAASAAALSGKRIVTAETFTCLYGWPREHMRNEKVTDLKLVADGLFAHGLNQVVWHGTPFNPKGSDTVSFYATVHAGKAGSLTKDIPSFNGYLKQVSEYMREGTVYTNTAIYLPIEDSWIAGELPEDKQLPWAWGEYELRYLQVPEEIRGWQPLWINGQFLEEGLEDLKAYGPKEKGVGQSAVIRVQDCEFSLLYVDARYLDYHVLKTMVELGEKGLKICLKRIPGEAGHIRHPDFEMLAARLAVLGSDEWPVADTHKPLVEGDDLPWFWARETGNKLLVFFAHPMAKEFKYPVKYGQADTEETLKQDIRINFKGKEAHHTLIFKPYESLLLEISPDATCRPVPLPEFSKSL